MREAKITRTFAIFEAEYVGIDITTGQTEVKITAFTKVPKDILGYIRKHEETETYKIIAVNSVNMKEKRYGMLEKDFLKYAEEMPLLEPKRKKQNKTTNN